MPPKPSDRRRQILEALAEMLEASPGERITTARLARQVGVSEAALYRHFPSKSKIFEGLIEFIEDSLFSRVNLILNGNGAAAARCEKILALLLGFAERNPGLARILTGDALAGETERLRARVAQLYGRVETQLKQVLREAELRDGAPPRIPAPAAANMLLALAEGKIAQYVRSDFKRAPLQNWPDQWPRLSAAIFPSAK